MTEEEYKLVAAAIKRTRERYGDLDDLIWDLAGKFQLADPGFDAVRFMIASGLREDSTLATGRRREMTCRADVSNVIGAPLMSLRAESS